MKPIRGTEAEMTKAGWVKQHSSLYTNAKGNRELFLDTRYGRWAIRANGACRLLQARTLGEAFGAALQPAQQELLP